MTIGIIAQKGGSCKTTTCAHLARLFASQKPLVVDADWPQQSLLSFDLPKCIVRACPIDEAPGVLRTVPHKLAFVDCKPSVRESVPILETVDALIIPAISRHLGVDSTVRFTDSVKKRYPEVPIKLLITMHGIKGSGEYRQAYREAYGGDCFNTCISNNASIYDAASRQGQTVIDYAPDSPAARQWNEIHQEVKEWLKQLNRHAITHT